MKIKDQKDVFRLAYLHPRYWLLWTVFVLLSAVARLPHRVLISVGRQVGRFGLRLGLFGSRIHVARVNLEKCFPELSDDRREQLLCRHFESLGIGLAEVVMAWWGSPQRLSQRVTVRGEENLLRLQQQGGLILMAHTTNLELGGMALGASGAGNVVIYRKHSNPFYEYMQNRRRVRYCRGGSQLVERNDVRTIVRALRTGAGAFYSPDQDMGLQRSVFAPFFGVEAATVTATARLLKHGRTELFPVTFIRRENGAGYVLEFHSPWQGFPTGDDRSDATRVNGFIESVVRRAPEQYYWVHRRFKTRPVGESGFYSR